MSECGIHFDHFYFEGFISNIEPVYHQKLGMDRRGDMKKEGGRNRKRDG